VLRFIALTSLLLAGCPDEADHAAEDDPFDFFAGEGTEWRWGQPTCVVYTRDAGAPATARWFDGSRLVRGGELSGRDTSSDFRRGFYVDTGRLAIEYGEGQGYYVKRFYYDENDRLSEIVQRGATSTHAYHTWLAYDDRDRLVARHSERASAAPLFESWTYAPIGALESYRAEANGRLERGFIATRVGSGLLVEVKRWLSDRSTVYQYEYSPDYLLVHARVVDEQDPAATLDISYEYDDKRRIVARTIAPWARDEAGQRTELVFGDQDVVEKRDLTANGLLRARSVFERSANGDVRLVIDGNGDGEPDRGADLRDECYGRYVPEFAAVFSPRLAIDGEPPFRPEI